MCKNKPTSAFPKISLFVSCSDGVLCSAHRRSACRCARRRLLRCVGIGSAFVVLGGIRNCVADDRSQGLSVAFGVVLGVGVVFALCRAACWVLRRCWCRVRDRGQRYAHGGGACCAAAAVRFRRSAQRRTRTSSSRARRCSASTRPPCAPRRRPARPSA